jgi:hypothetical protein
VLGSNVITSAAVMIFRSFALGPRATTAPANRQNGMIVGERVRGRKTGRKSAETVAAMTAGPSHSRTSARSGLQPQLFAADLNAYGDTLRDLEVFRAGGTRAYQLTPLIPSWRTGHSG